MIIETYVIIQFRKERKCILYRQNYNHSQKQLYQLLKYYKTASYL